MKSRTYLEIIQFCENLSFSQLKAFKEMYKLDKNKEFSSVPTMAKAMYEDILKIIYDAGKSMEMKPKLYLNKV